jgi:serine protease Do
MRGEVIGITTAVTTRSGGGEGLGYAIPMDERTRAIIAQLLRGEPVEYGFLGVQLDEPSGEDRENAGAPAGAGALVRQVERNTPADLAKLQPGDIVVEFDGVAVHDTDQLIRMVGAARVGSPVSVTFYRGGSRQTVKAVPARRDVPPGINAYAPLSWRGLTLAEITPELRRKYGIDDDLRGVVVTAIDPAVLDQVEAVLREDIQEGVVLTHVAGTPVHGLAEFRTATAQTRGAVKISLSAGDLAMDVTLPARSR